MDRYDQMMTSCQGKIDPYSLVLKFEKEQQNIICLPAVIRQQRYRCERLAEDTKSAERVRTIGTNARTAYDERHDRLDSLSCVKI